MARSPRTEATPVRGDRPEMPAGYGVASPDAVGLPWSWAEERLDAARNYWIVTSSEAHGPAATPVWGAWVGGSVWFGSEPGSRRVRNLAGDPRAVVHLESGDEVVIVHGRGASAVPPSGERAAIDAAFARKYVDPVSGRPFDLAAAVPADQPLFRVRAERVLCWLEDDFVDSRTRFHFDPVAELR